MTPTHVPGLAEAQGRKAAALHRAHRLLQHAAVAPGVIHPDDAVAHAVRILRGPKAPERPRIIRLP